uniref:Uncharacterized protein n=1 Tax=Rhizophora mucronata TaxID=61149 RepID=A0A2P2PAG2_RHIMU
MVNGNNIKCCCNLIQTQNPRSQMQLS